MKRMLKKGIALTTALATVLGSSLMTSAASNSTNVGTNEQALLEWIASKPSAVGGTDSTIYKLAKEQFEYTTDDITEDVVATVEEALKGADDLADTEDDSAANRLAMLEYALTAADAIGGYAIALSDLEEDGASAETDIGFVRFNQDNKKDIEVIYLGVTAEPTVYTETRLLSVAGEIYPIVDGKTVDTNRICEIDGVLYELGSDGSYNEVAEEDTANLGENELSLLDWIASRKTTTVTGGFESTIYILAKEQLSYTTDDISAEAVATVENALTDANSVARAGINTTADKLQILDDAQTAATAINSYAIVLASGTLNDVENEIGFVRLNPENKDRIECIYLGVTAEPTLYKATRFVTVGGQKYPIVDGHTVDENGYYQIEGEWYYCESNGYYVAVPEVDVTYSTHIQTYGWNLGESKNGQYSGSFGQAKRLEGIKINNNKAGLGITYTTHVQTYGWLDWSSNGEFNGTQGEAKRLEAIEIKLFGAMAKHYDVYYRVHAQSYGWMGWAKNGEKAGTAGGAKRLEAIQIVIVPKWATFDGTKYVVKENNVSLTNSPYLVLNGAKDTNPPTTAAPTITYTTHVQSYGWQKYVKNGAVAGTSGEAKRLEAIKINLQNKPYEGGVKYSTHIQTYGWKQGYVNDGALAGTSGEAKRLEAIKIELTGEIANHFDVYYRVHAEKVGWMGWAKNGEEAGTAGYARRLEGIQIVVLPKGQTPSNTYNGVTSVTASPFIQK